MTDYANLTFLILSLLCLWLILKIFQDNSIVNFITGNASTSTSDNSAAGYNAGSSNITNAGSGGGFGGRI